MGDPLRLYIDANIFISAFEQSGPVGETCQKILRIAEEESMTVVSSELTLSEILIGPLRQNDNELFRIYIDLFTGSLSKSSNFSSVPVDLDVLIRAAEFRTTLQRLKLPDAIHLATADLLKCDFFVSADKAICYPDTVPRLDPSDPELFDLIRTAQ